MNTLISNYFGLTPPVTKSALIKRFRELAKEKHPDTGGSDEAFKELKLNFDAAIGFAVDDSQQERDATHTIDGVPLINLGYGHPRHVSAVECDRCQRRGWIETVHYRYVHGTCDHTFPVPCKSCGRTGRYTNKRGEKVDCWSCQSTGWRRITVSDPYRCRKCYGLWWLGTTAESETVKVVCNKCDGVGEVILFNPVLQRGSIFTQPKRERRPKEKKRVLCDCGALNVREAVECWKCASEVRV
jgi:DnaJ-class molecular chaperone